MDILTNVARNLTFDQRITLALFHDAHKKGQAVRAGLNDLPSGFLMGVGYDKDLHPLFELSDFGLKVADAVERMEKVA